MSEHELFMSRDSHYEQKKATPITLHCYIVDGKKATPITLHCYIVDGIITIYIYTCAIWCSPLYLSHQIIPASKALNSQTLRRSTSLLKLLRQKHVSMNMSIFSNIINNTSQGFVVFIRILTCVCLCCSRPHHLPCKAKRQYLLTLQVSRYCLLALQSSPGNHD